uniref:Coiled-coil domain-containing protein 51 n=1 Tax=Graphocephala atropunctata TaxID=36148 RepID=A0A1B6LD19_9HEMI
MSQSMIPSFRVLIIGKSVERVALNQRIVCVWPLFSPTSTKTENYILRGCQTHSLTSSKFIFDSSETNFIKKKIDDLVTKYEQITGMDEVRKAQNRVIEAQDKFIIAQEKRRDLVKELTSIQNKLKEVYGELEATTRGEERYLTLVTREHNLLKEERKLTAQFNLSEQEERECFTFLSSSLKESHEKERAQAERTKYWSVIGSVIGTVIGVVGSSINNEFKMRELRKLVMESAAHSQQSVEVDKMAAAVLTRHEEQLSQIIGEMRSVNGN